MIFFCSLGEVGGVGAEPPQKGTNATTAVKPILPYNEADKNGEQDFFLFPVFGGVVARQKFILSMV